MGINGLWGVLGDGEVVTVAKLATDHLKAHGRPLRIAVDAAGWRFKNLNPYQVAAIKEKEPRANPVEKAILFRCIRLLQIGIDLLFVWDGPRRPWKHGKSSGGAQRIHEESALLRSILGVLKIPQHEAPGEAEAECAALQMAGIVDVVWSEDGDALMFGCTTLIRDYREEGKREAKSTTHVRYYQADRIKRDHDIDQRGLMLFVILSGGDYEASGLLGCGANTARKVVRTRTGLGAGLWNASGALELAIWRDQLRNALAKTKNAPDVPDFFPRDLVLRNYKHPVVSTPEQMATFMDKPSHQWDREIDEEKLRNVLTAKFNFQEVGYLKHIEPIYFVRTLLRTEPGQQASNNGCKVTVVKQKNVDVETSDTLKVRFLSRQAQSYGDNASAVFKLVEVETLSHILRQGLVDGALDQPAARTRKKKVAPDDDDSDQAGPAVQKASKKRKTKATEQDGVGNSTQRKRSSMPAEDDVEALPKQKRTKKSLNSSSLREARMPIEVDTDASELPSFSSLLSVGPPAYTPRASHAPRRAQQTPSIHTLNTTGPNFDDQGDGDDNPPLPPLRELLRHPALNEQSPQQHPSTVGSSGPMAGSAWTSSGSSSNAFVGPGRRLGSAPSMPTVRTDLLAGPGPGISRSGDKQPSKGPARKQVKVEVVDLT